MRVTVGRIITAYLERHEQTLTLDIGEAEVDTAGVTMSVTVADDMLDTRADALDETVGQLFNASLVPLQERS